LDHIVPTADTASATAWAGDELTRGLHQQLGREIVRGHGGQDTSNLALTASGIVGIWDGDLIDRKVYGDANFARIYGFDPAEMAAGKPLGYFFNLMHPEDRPGADAARAQMMAGQGDFSHEHRVFRPDGSIIWVFARGRLLHDDAGTPIRFIGVSVDITERRLAEARQAFMLDLQDELRQLSEPRDILTAAAVKLGRHLRAARIGYSEIQADGETVLITNGYANGLPPVNGLFALSSFGARHAARTRAGMTLAYEDVQADDLDTHEFGVALGTRAHVSVPLVRNGRYFGSLYVTHSKPYKWSPAEISLIESVAARVWEAAERGRSEARLRESEERLRLVLESTGLGSWEYDVKSGAMNGSPRHDEIFGYPSPQPSWSFEQLINHVLEPDRPEISAGFQATLAHGRDWSAECRITRADGKPAWIKINARPQLGPGGEVIRLLGAIADISERKTVETEAKETAVKFETFAQSMPSMVWTSLPDGKMEWLNARVAEYCGMNESELKPDGWSPVHPDDAEQATKLFSEALTKGTPYVAEYRVLRYDGEYRWHLTRAVPIRDANGTITRWIGTSSDIQDQKNTEQALADMNATLETQVRERTAELMAAEATLRQSQKMEAVGQLTGGLAHDFNNLLTGVSGSLELLETRLAQGRFAELDRYVHTAQSATKRAAALTHRLLAFSRRQTLDPKPTDVNRLIAGIDELIRRTMGPAIAVTVSAQEHLCAVLADPNQLENALLNLCINARDAMPDGGSLTIETANLTLDAEQAKSLELEAGAYVSLSVIDTGGGMTPQIIARAFDPFFTTKPIGEGTGLGLSMVYGFARQSGGQARIISALGKGTSVSLFLPRYLGAPPDVQAAAGPETAMPGGGETVLVVDDESTVRMLVSEVLDELGYETIEAEDAASGLKYLQTARRIDLLVTDVGLPGGMNGRQLADAALSLRPGLKILFITGYAETAVIGQGQLQPGMHVMTKPFSLDGLGRRIKEIMTAP
jgi:PAS domain S-box-containing protein